MDCLYLVYLLSLSLQVSGTLILIFFCWGSTKKLVLRAVYPANTIIERNEDDTVTISKKKLYEAHKEVLLNRIAFISLFCGYLLSIIGTNNGMNVWSGLLMVFMISCILSGLEYAVAHLIAKMSNKKDRTYSYKVFKNTVDKDVAATGLEKDVRDIVQEYKG